MSVWRFLLMISLAVLSPVYAHAHAEGQSFEELTNTYFVDIGYDLPLQVGQETLIDFGLFTVKNKQPDELANFTNVTVRIHSGSTVLFQRSIDKPEFGKAFATVTPKDSGNWVLTAEFSLNGVLLHSATFDILIPTSQSSDIAFSIFFIVTIMTIASILKFIRSRIIS